MHSQLWLIGPVLSLVLGAILVGQGLWRSRHNSVRERAPSKGTVFALRAVLLSSGLFLIIISALLAFGFEKR